MPRWLLPLFVVAALIGQAVTSYAAAGMIGESKCCCPKPESCKCHDHGGKGTEAELERCSGEAKLVAPACVVAVPAIQIAIGDVPRVTALVVHAIQPIPDDISRELEKPPF